jgi:metal-sulfur cluster biosynthetic enzyme
LSKSWLCCHFVYVFGPFTAELKRRIKFKIRLKKTESKKIMDFGIPLQNANPQIFAQTSSQSRNESLRTILANEKFKKSSSSTTGSSSNRDPIDREEVFELIRHLNDPEHPLTLEQLNVASLELIDVVDDEGDASCGRRAESTVDVRFTPTIPHCSMSTLIGLSIRVKLLRSLPPRFKIKVRITPGAHNQEEAVNKQLEDKERVAAALENLTLLEVVNKAIKGTDRI